MGHKGQLEKRIGQIREGFLKGRETIKIKHNSIYNKQEVAEIMEKEILISYDEGNDILLLRRHGQKYAGSIEIGDFIIDFSQNMQTAVAIEILNASKILSDISGIEISRDMLSGLKKAELKTVNKGDAIYVYYGILLHGKAIKSMIPIPQPLEAV